MKKKILALSFCMIILLTTACGKTIPKTKNGEEIVASIDGKDFTADELYSELKKSYGYNSLINMINLYIGEKEVETTEEVKKYADDAIAYYKSYAEAYGLDFETFLVNFVGGGITTEEEFREMMIKNRKVSVAIENYVKENLTEEEIEKYYNENYSERLSVRHILIEIEESDKDGEKAKETANNLIEELKKTDKDKLEEKFIELAKEYSDDGTYSTGGLYENFMSSTVVSEFWDASSKLKDGGFTTTPVKTTYGYHVILRKSSSAKPTLEESKDAIKDALVEKKLTDDTSLQETALAELRKKYHLDIKDSDINTEYKEYLESLEK